MSHEESKSKVLIVDDEVRLTRSLDSLVRAMGLRSRVVHSGFDAQELLLVESFDLIVTDLLMPGMSGFDLIDFAQQRGVNAPIVVLTGEGTVKAAVRALKQGAYDFVVKPFEPEHFRSILHRALEKSSFEKKRLEQARQAELLQAEVRQSKQYLELVLQSAEDVAILTTNREGRIKTFNSGAEKLLGTTVDEVLGRSIDVWFPYAQMIKVTQDFLSGRRTESWHEEFQIRNQRGELVWVHVVMRWMESASPSLAGLIVVATDITQRRLLQEKLKMLSITDDLTGLYNQRYFYEALPREIERSNRKNATFGLALFDIDHFKRYNDDFGHLRGDEILRGIGTIVLSTIRRIDFGFRYGGDEFAILLPETTIENSLQIAERLRVNAETQFDGAVTLSIGIVEGGPHCEERDLIASADKAMYEAKRAGGNRVFSPHQTPSLPNS
jgi:diguanylate cyclase (GGDEF)-like protein/PAS domain S-box-containing protein